MDYDVRQKNISWIGLGILGEAIVRTLLKNGFINLHAYNRTEKKVEGLVSCGLKPEYSIKNIFDCSDIIFTCLGSEHAFNQTIYSNIQILNSQKRNKILIDLGTISPDLAIKYANTLKKWKIEYIECPVSGGREGAISQQLTAICAGDKQSFNNIQEILKYFCKHIHFVGAQGNAQKLKIINNLAESINLMCATEVIYLGMKMGFDIKTLMPVLTTARGRSAYLELLLVRLSNEGHDVAVTLDIRNKDLSLALDLINQFRVKTYLSNITVDFFDKTSLKYGGNQDQTKCFDFFKDLQK